MAQFGRASDQEIGKITNDRHVTLLYLQKLKVNLSANISDLGKVAQPLNHSTTTLTNLPETNF